MNHKMFFFWLEVSDCSCSYHKERGSTNVAGEGQLNKQCIVEASLV